MTAPNADLLQGTLDLLILKALSLGPLHARRVIQRVRQLPGEMLGVEQGRSTRRSIGSSSAAPVRSRWGMNETGRRAKFYTLTGAGRKQLTVEEESRGLLAPANTKAPEAT